MTQRRMKLLMKKLKQMIYGNDNPQVGINLSISRKSHPLQLLYEELGSMIRTTLFVEKVNDDIQVRNLKRRVNDVVEEAHDILDLFVSKAQMIITKFYIFHFPLELVEEVMIAMKSIKEDYFSIILHNMNMNMKKMESSPTTDDNVSLKPQCAAAAGVTSSSRNYYSPVWDEIVVGLDRDIDCIRDKLAEDTKKLDIVSIVGMGGSGKTTLATKVFNDPFIVYHFNIRMWVTVSQTYEKTDLLNQILASIGVEIDHDKRDNYSHLREKLHKRLMGQRYLVVIDDIWSTEAWDDLKIVFPNNNTGSRLLLTSRDKKVAFHAKPHGFIHKLRCLTDEESWELLRKKVFHGHDYPDLLTGLGMQIARNCRGLPLAVVVIAGVLAKEPVIKDSWERISQSGCSSLIFEGHMETLALSLNHLPSHLRNCFLYLGGFPEDYRFRVTWLIWLWIAEGFIQQVENQSLEETAKDYLMELVDRNLVVVQDRKFDRAIKTCSVHDVLRELSSEIATKERFSRKVLGWKNCIIAPYKTSRLYIPPYTKCFSLFTPLLHYRYSYESYIALKCSRSWKLLTVLDFKQCHLKYSPENISLLVNLRYLAIRNDYGDFQSSICNLRSLQTLIIEGISGDPLVLPNTISNLVNLKHLQCCRAIKFSPLETPLMNLQTVSNVVWGDEPTSWVGYFPGVKKLSCSIYGDRKYDLKSLTFLQTLKISCTKSKSIPRFEKKSMIKFPTSLTKLTLKGCHLPWSNMSNIQSLPNLEVLKLLNGAFVGPRWDAGEDPFEQLKFLKLENLDIQQWEACSINFPCLKQLVLCGCYSLEGIPLDMSYIPTLDHIQIQCCDYSVIKSAYEIQEEQHADGNYNLKIRYEMLPSTDLRYWYGPQSLFSMQKLKELFNDLGERRTSSNIRIKTGTSINLLTPSELETLGLPINDPPAHHHIRRSRTRNNARSKCRPIKREVLKGGGRIRLFQY